MGLGTGSVEEPLVSVLHNPTSPQPGWWLLPGAPLPSSPDIQKWALARLLLAFSVPLLCYPDSDFLLLRSYGYYQAGCAQEGQPPDPARGVKRPGLLLSPVAQVGSSQGSPVSMHLPRWAGPLSPRARSAAGRQSAVLGPGQEGRQPCPHRARHPPTPEDPDPRRASTAPQGTCRLGFYTCPSDCTCPELRSLHCWKERIAFSSKELSLF